jgi:hypothetical protein
MHLFVADPGLPQLTAVIWEFIWAACVLLCLCTAVQVPCYDVGRSLPYISRQAYLAGVGSTSPARGRPVADMLLCLLRSFVYDFR